MKTLIDLVKDIEKKYQEIFRRPSVGLLLERISQLEDEMTKMNKDKGDATIQRRQK